MCLWEIVENNFLGWYCINFKEVSYYLPFFASMSDDIRYETFVILQTAPVNIITVNKQLWLYNHCVTLGLIFILPDVYYGVPIIATLAITAGEAVHSVKILWS